MMVSIPEIIETINESVSSIERGDYDYAKERLQKLRGKLIGEVVVTQY